MLTAIALLIAVVFIAIMLGIVLLLLLAVVTRPLWLLSIDGYALRHLEKNARKAVTADQLQAWATNLLAHPEDIRLRNNYPRALRRVHPLRPPRTSIHTNLNSPPFVTLDWDEVDIVAELEIGPTSFVGDGHKWQDGVYFLFQQ